MDIEKAKKAIITALLLYLIVLCSSCATKNNTSSNLSSQFSALEYNSDEYTTYSMSSIPEYSGENYIFIDNNVPDFYDLKTNTQGLLKSWDYFSDLDALGRCGKCLANIGPDSIYDKIENRKKFNPTGWYQAKYDSIDGKYLYYRCQLIWECFSENANSVNNTITGTHEMVFNSILPFERSVLYYINNTGNHVLYRATPIFKDDEFLARGIHLEALSVEDDGAGICFNIFCYNAQPGINIDYKTGKNSLSH